MEIVSEDSPAFDDLERGHVVVGGDAFTDGDTRRPYVVANDESHPFDGEQYVGLGLTTRTWYDERIPLAPSDFTRGAPPRESSVVPHAVVSLTPADVRGYVGRIHTDVVDRAVAQLVTYLGYSRP